MAEMSTITAVCQQTGSTLTLANKLIVKAKMWAILNDLERKYKYEYKKTGSQWLSFPYSVIWIKSINLHEENTFLVLKIIQKTCQARAQH